MKLYFKHSNNGLDAAQITITHFNTEGNSNYEIHTSFKEALLLIESAQESYSTINLRTSGDSQGNMTNAVVKLYLRGVVRINP